MRTSSPPSFAEQVAAFINRYDLVSPGSNVLVAVSGGPDSCALFLVLSSKKEQLKINRLGAVYVDHGFRKEAAQEALFVKKLAQEHQAEFYTGELHLSHGAGDEERARSGRYNLINQIADQHNFDLIALAHHADDLAETMLINLTRGSGPLGLRGIIPKRGRYIRPLLDQRRTAIEKYCAEQAIIPCLDHTNLECDYLRNRIRLKLLPLWTEAAQRDVVPIIGRFGQIISADEEFMENESQAALAEITCQDNFRALYLEKFRSLPLALQRRCARLAISRAMGRYYQPSFEQIMQFLAVVKAGRGQLWLADNLELVVEDGLLLIRERQPENGNFTENKEKLLITTPGNYKYENIELTVSQLFSEENGTKRLDQTKSVVFSAAEIEWPLKLRTPYDGEKIALFGHNKSISIREILSNMKVPPEKRSKQLLLCDNNDRVMWVIGYRRSSLAPVKGNKNEPLVKVDFKLIKES